VLRLRGGPGFKNGNFTFYQSIIPRTGILKQDLPKTKRTNPLFGEKLEGPSKHHIYQYRLFNKHKSGGSGLAFIANNS